jgi:hypothetical protein
MKIKTEDGGKTVASGCTEKVSAHESIIMDSLLINPGITTNWDRGPETTEWETEAASTKMSGRSRYTIPKPSVPETGGT